MPPGSELGWAALAGATAPYYATETFKYLVFNDAAWTPATRPITLGADVAAAERAAAPINADNPDLSAFFARGGRLIQVHGWTDPLIAPGDSIDYYNRVKARLGDQAVEQHVRLFMVPGMNHCQGGEGADSLATEPVIERWVERGEAPASIVASKIANGRTERTHLLCPYPQEAAFTGPGSPDDADNYECRIVR
jgi:feruloyl esterase